MRYTVGTLQYRQFFSMLALTAGATTSLGLLLSLPTTFIVPSALAEATSPQSPVQATTLPKLVLPEQQSVEMALPSTSSHNTNIETPRTEATGLTASNIAALPTEIKTITASSSVFTVPFFSQLTDITAASWKKVGCGITSLAMLIEFYHPHTLASVDSLLQEGITAGAYNDAVGWSYNGLLTVAKKYGLGGSTHDYKDSSMDTAFVALENDVHEGPVMASVHYTFKASNPIPHLVIINGIKNGLVYYNDPAASAGGKSISVAQFKEGWKKRYIEFHTTT